jgi:hypothetical protein
MYDKAGEDDRILGQTTGLLAQRGDEEAVALLVDVRSLTIASTSEVARTERVFLPDIEGGVWGTETIYLVEAVLDVDDHLVSRFTEEVCQRIARTLSYVAGRNGALEDVPYVRGRPALPEVGGDWRAAYAARLACDRPINQARRESGGAHPAEDGLTFGSAEEQRVYRALRHLQKSFPEEETISIAPLPGVRLRAGHTWGLTSWSWAAAVSSSWRLTGPIIAASAVTWTTVTGTCSGGAAGWRWSGWPSRTSRTVPRSLPGSVRKSSAISASPAEALRRGHALAAPLSAVTA